MPLNYPIPQNIITSRNEPTNLFEGQIWNEIDNNNSLIATWIYSSNRDTNNLAWWSPIQRLNYDTFYTNDNPKRILWDFNYQILFKNIFLGINLQTATNASNFITVRVQVNNNVNIFNLICNNQVANSSLVINQLFNSTATYNSNSSIFLRVDKSGTVTYNATAEIHYQMRRA
jgi:hypothetical protein